jgi:predicted nucleotidyltransferase
VDQQRVLDDVVAWATNDPNVRLVLVTGSFARGDHDELSDLDIELYVRETHPLLEETAWYERFGEVLVTEALENPEWCPTRLVYYFDGKIDFMIAPVRSLSEGAEYDGPYLVPVDKDGRADRLEPTVGVTPPRCVPRVHRLVLRGGARVREGRRARRPVAGQDPRCGPEVAAPADARMGARRPDRMGVASSPQRLADRRVGGS